MILWSSKVLGAAGFVRHLMRAEAGAAIAIVTEPILVWGFMRYKNRQQQ